MAKYIIAITGASGSAYAWKLISSMLNKDIELYLMITEPAKKVIRHELGIDVTLFNAKYIKKLFSSDRINYIDYNDLEASVSSGSFKVDGMVVVPCSMSTLSAIANGSSNNLLERAADVTLKERRPLIIVPRETPLNQIHLKNMLSLNQAGAVIVPAMPGFYNNPKTIDDIIGFVAGKILDLLGIENSLYKRWINSSKN